MTTLTYENTLRLDMNLEVFVAPRKADDNEMLVKIRLESAGRYMSIELTPDEFAVLVEETEAELRCRRER